MNGIEDIIVNIFVAGSDQDPALKLQLILLPSLLLDNLLSILILALIFPINAITINVLDTLSILVVLSTRELGVSVIIMILLLVIIQAFDLILVLLFVWDVQKLEQSTFKLLLIIFDDLHEHGIFDDAYALLLEDPLYLGLDVLIFEGLRVDEGEVSGHVLLLLLIVLITQMTGVLRDHQGYLLCPHTPCQQALDAGVGAQGTPVDHTVLGATSVRQDVHQRPTQSQMVIQFGIVY